jgi:hypothetical protein
MVSPWYHGVAMTPLKGLRFRMTPQQHEQLLRDAQAAGRSLQKEIEFRVFGGLVAGEVGGGNASGGVPGRRARVGPSPSKKDPGASPAASSSEEVALRSVDDPLGPPRVLAPFQEDPKTNKEHAREPKRARTQTCEHRVPLGSFCKRCEEGSA